MTKLMTTATAVTVVLVLGAAAIAQSDRPSSEARIAEHKLRSGIATDAIPEGTAMCRTVEAFDELYLLLAAAMRSEVPNKSAADIGCGDMETLTAVARELPSGHIEYTYIRPNGSLGVVYEDPQFKRKVFILAMADSLN